MKHLTLEEWDKHVGPMLSYLRHDANWALYYAKSISGRIGMLPNIPEWPTEAEDSLRQARDELATATFLLTESLNQIQMKEKVK